jgi:ketosteroid isomerase-like protein
MNDAASNAARVSAAYHAWQDNLGSDPEPFIALIGEDFTMASVLDPPDLHELAADHDGIDRVRDYFAAIEADWEMIDFPTEQVVEQGDTVVGIGRCTWRNRHTGAVVATPKVDVWTFRDGRAVRMFEMFDTLGFARASGMLPQLVAQFG